MSEHESEREEAGFDDVTTVRVIRVNQLQVDPFYQRDVKSKHRHIAKNFNPLAYGRPLVGERDDGSLWIVDGLQRWTVAKILGRVTVSCDVFKSEGQAHEAKIYTTLNSPKGRSNLTPSDLFRGMNACCDSTAKAIMEVVESEGFVVKLHKGGTRTTDETRAKQLTCISTLIKVTESWGADALRFALNTMARAWPNDPARTSILIIGSLGLFHYKRGGCISDEVAERLIVRLQHVSPVEFFQKAKAQSITHFSGDRFAQGYQILEAIFRKRKVGG